MIPDPELLDRLAPSATTPAEEPTEDWKAEARASLTDYRARLGDLSEHGKQAFARYQAERREARRKQAEAAPAWESWMVELERAA
jgi:hypothetical protein